MLVRRGGLPEMGLDLFWARGVCLFVVSLGAVRCTGVLCGRGAPYETDPSLGGGHGSEAPVWDLSACLFGRFLGVGRCVGGVSG